MRAYLLSKIRVGRGRSNRSSNPKFIGKKRGTAALGVLLLSVGLSGCAGMSTTDSRPDAPDFDFISYFTGHTSVSGWFADRFGNVKRHFCGDFFGELRGDVLHLDEKLYYSDGVVEERIWDVTVSESGEFSAESDSLVGKAVGLQKGNVLEFNYLMNVLIAEDKVWRLKMDDYMFYQPDGSLHNSTIVKKWGIRIGNVSTQYQKHDGSKTCLANQEQFSLTG